MQRSEHRSVQRLRSIEEHIKTHGIHCVSLLYFTVITCVQSMHLSVNEWGNSRSTGSCHYEWCRKYLELNLSSFSHVVIDPRMVPL